MPFSHNLLAKLQVDSPAPFRFPRFNSVQWVLAFSCRLPLSSQVIPVFWADGKTTDVSVKKPSACEDKFPSRSDTLLYNIETLQVRFDIFQAGIQRVKSCKIRISPRNIAVGLTNGRKWAWQLRSWHLCFRQEIDLSVLCARTVSLNKLERV